jgi:hypothetical protein
LHILRRLADLAVVMNARLIEVDKQIFDQHLAPLFVGSAEKPEGPGLARADDNLIKLLNKQKVILREEQIKVCPGQSEVFLSFSKPFRILNTDQDRRPEIIQSGVGFSVKAAISDDRRRLEVKIIQSINDLIEVKKAIVLDVKTGVESETEVPTVLNKTVTGSLIILDGQPIIMPVGYRSAEAKKQNRLWVLLAEPIIYIQEEQDLVRQGLIPPFPAPQTANAPNKKKKPVTPERSEKVEQILQALVNDILTSQDLKDYREYQSHLAQKKFRLVDGEKVAWPNWFHPAVTGLTQIPDNENNPDNLELNPAKAFNIRLDKFDLSQLKWEGSDTPIRVFFHNPAYFSGPMVHYAPKREGDRWTVEMQGSHSP